MGLWIDMNSTLIIIMKVWYNPGLLVEAKWYNIITISKAVG